jgi:hypothetical protein
MLYSLKGKYYKNNQAISYKLPITWFLRSRSWLPSNSNMHAIGFFWACGPAGLKNTVMLRAEFKEQLPQVSQDSRGSPPLVIGGARLFACGS